MSTAQLEIQLVAAVTAVACAIPGVYLVLRRLSLVSDAISHAVLLGIVVAFLISGELASPLLPLGAVATGLLTVMLVDVLRNSGLVREDTAIGLTFPFLFSIAVILIARNAGNVHLDTDAVLLGELAFAPFNRFEFAGLDFGPQALVVMGGMLLLNVALVVVLYKELKLSAFDPELAAALGFAPGAVHLLLMCSVSMTTLTAFDAVGSILVVGLMIGPPATAFLLVESLGAMLLMSGALGVGAAILGYWVANLLDASIGGAIAASCGTLFLAAVVGSPTRGVVAVWLRRARQRRLLGAGLVVARLRREQQPVALTALTQALAWDRRTLAQAVAAGQAAGLLVCEDGLLRLLPAGHANRPDDAGT
jgi:manganese/zinc/iron transport system permease protein